MENFVRPKAQILSEKSLIPKGNLISPPPNQFTHELIRSQSFYYLGAAQGSPPDGEFPEGTKVILLRYEGGSYCHVVDEQGLYAEVEFDSLRRL